MSADISETHTEEDFPAHFAALWLNQTEIWFSILVCKLIRRGNFQSKSDLPGKI